MWYTITWSWVHIIFHYLLHPVHTPSHTTYHHIPHTHLESVSSANFVHFIPVHVGSGNVDGAVVWPGVVECCRCHNVCVSGSFYSTLGLFWVWLFIPRVVPRVGGRGCLHGALCHLQYFPCHTHPLALVLVRNGHFSNNIILFHNSWLKRGTLLCSCGALLRSHHPLPAPTYTIALLLEAFLHELSSLHLFCNSLTFTGNGSRYVSKLKLWVCFK